MKKIESQLVRLRVKILRLKFEANTKTGGRTADYDRAIACLILEKYRLNFQDYDQQIDS